MLFDYSYRNQDNVDIASLPSVECPEKGERYMMLFIALLKFKKKPSKEIIAENVKMIESDAKDGVKFLSHYWTLGRYDAVAIFEALNEKVAMKMSIRRGEVFTMETLVAVPVEEARKLVE